MKWWHNLFEAVTEITNPVSVVGLVVLGLVFIIHIVSKREFISDTLAELIKRVILLLFGLGVLAIVLGIVQVSIGQGSVEVAHNPPATIQLRPLNQETYSLDNVNIDFELVLYILRRPLASGLSVAILEPRFVDGLGIWMRNHYQANQLYEECFREMAGFPNMSDIVGAFVLWEIVYIDREKYLLTTKGRNIVEQYVAKDSNEDRRTSLRDKVYEVCFQWIRPEGTASTTPG